jgi:allantoinase
LNSAAPFILRSQRVVLPEGTRPAAVLVERGRIASIFPHDDLPVSCRVEDVGSSVVMPGLVDAHVHLNEPGRTAWEGFATGTQAAAAGGVTTLVDMPLNSAPVTTTRPALEQKVEAARGSLWVDVGFHAGVVPGQTDHLEALVQAGVLGAKAFLVHSGIEDFPAADEATLRAALPVLARHGVPLLVHAEMESIPPPPRGAVTSYQAWLASRPRAWENDAIALLIRLCREYRTPLHIVHLSSSDALPALMRARAEGLPVTVETCPHYLFFQAEEIPDGATAFKCAPPIRERENNQKLRNALRQGVIDQVCTDHSPCPPEMKRMEEGDFFRAWGGIASLQWSLPALWTALRDDPPPFEQLARWLCAHPARLAGLGRRKGALAPGYDADFVVWEPDASFEVRPESTYHRHKVSPYVGRSLYGMVERTYLRGERIAERGAVCAGARGAVLLGRDR